MLPKSECLDASEDACNLPGLRATFLAGSLELLSAEVATVFPPQSGCGCGCGIFRSSGVYTIDKSEPCLITLNHQAGKEHPSICPRSPSREAMI